MSALAKLFPNATPPDRWTPPTAVQEAEKHANVRDCNLPNADYLMAHHAVSTYDARDEALREALKALKVAAEDCGPDTGLGGAPTGPNGYAVAIAFVESALAVKP